MGAYEGGYYRTYGIWRPQETCQMQTTATPYFCHVCREALVQAILERANITYDFDEFLAKNSLDVTGEVYVSSVRYPRTLFFAQTAHGECFRALQEKYGSVD